MAKYSIILPVHNGGHYLKQCIGSILSQTYTDFNCIILENASTDGTLEWLQSVKDDRITIISSEKLLTIEENWGRITGVKKNEFITLIGHDDILYPDFLDVMNRQVTSKPEASLYHTHFNYIDASGNIRRPCKPMNPSITGYEFLQAFLTNSIDSMGTGYVMRSADYDALQGIPLKYPNLLFADFELWLNLTFKGYEVVAPEKCFAFRIHKSTTGAASDKKLHKALDVFIDFLSSLENRDAQAKEIINEYGVPFLMFYCKGFSNRLLRTPFYKREKLTVRDFIEHTKKLATKLRIQDKYRPENEFSVKLAAFIDSNTVSRKLFLLFKRIYPKPISK